MRFAATNFLAALAAVALVAPARAAASLTGAVYVTTLPAGAEVWCDATYVGRSPVYIELLAPGQHSVTVSRAGWQPEVATFNVDADKVAAVSLALRRGSPARTAPAGMGGQGALSVRGGPSGAVAFIDGVKAGALPLPARKVRAGFHIITLKMKGGGSTAQGVTVYPDTVTVALFPAVKTTGGR